jgi:FkbM family methyltransferase
MPIKFISDIDNYKLHFLSFVDDFVSWLYSEVYTTNKNHAMIDVGASIGKVTEILLNHCNKHTGLVIAIDAHPNWTKKFYHVNNQSVQMHNIGLYSKKCIKKFIDEEEFIGLGFIGTSPDKSKLNISKLKSFSLECNTLDNIVVTDKKISFIKIDAESSDFEIILGSTQIIKKHRPFIVFEFSGQIFEKAHASSRSDFFDFFKDINYNLYSVGLGKTEEQISKDWDKYTPEFGDILAVPAEYNHLV